MPDPKQVTDLTAADPARADEILFSDASAGNAARKSTFQNAMAKLFGIGTSTVAGLPSASPAGQFLLVTDGRKAGEGAGTGTGVLCQSNGSAWKTVDNGTTVAS